MRVLDGNMMHLMDVQFVSFNDTLHFRTARE